MANGVKLRGGDTRSCGCLGRELSSQRLKGKRRPTPTHCKKGHEYTPENTYWRVSQLEPEVRYPRCRACKAENSRGHVRKQTRRRVRDFVPTEPPCLEGENWRPIPGCPPYEVSDFGRVRSPDRLTAVKVDKSRWGMEYTAIVRHRGGILKQQLVRGGYLRVSLGRASRNYVARLVLLAFVGEPPPGDYEAAHDDGNPQNNTLTNLSWKTPKENAADKQRHGTAHWRNKQTHCRRGHKLEGHNVYVRKDNGHRQCLECIHLRRKGNAPPVPRDICLRGHEFTESNTWWRTNSITGRRHRICKACRQMDSRQAQAA